MKILRVFFRVPFYYPGEDHRLEVNKNNIFRDADKGIFTWRMNEVLIQGGNQFTRLDGGLNANGDPQLFDGTGILIHASTGGVNVNTNTFTHIEDSLYSNATLTTELLEYSFLSDTVLNAACMRYPFFSEVQFQEIVVKNSPVSRAVWPFLSGALEEIAQKNAAYVDTILSAQTTDTLRTPGLVERETEMAFTQRFRAITEIAGSLSTSDTIPDSTYALIHFLADSLPDKQWHKAAVGIALSIDTLSWSRTILDGIILENADDSLFYDYYDLALVLRADSLTWFGMDSAQRAFIADVAAGSSSLKEQAEAVHALLGDSSIIRIPEQYQGTPFFRLAEEEIEQPRITEEKSTVTVYPNPFQNQFNVAWELDSDDAKLQFEVFDLTGRSIYNEQIAASRNGKHVLNLGPCNGFYILRVSEDGKQLSQQKLLCIGG